MLGRREGERVSRQETQGANSLALLLLLTAVLVCNLFFHLCKH